MTNLKNVLNYKCRSLNNCGTSKTVVSTFGLFGGGGGGGKKKVSPRGGGGGDRLVHKLHAWSARDGTIQGTLVHGMLQ